VLNQDEVDPLFGQVDATLSQETVDLSAQVERAQRWGDIGVLVTVLLSRRAVTAVQGRRRRLEVRQQTEQRSEARYRTLIDKSSALVLVLGRGGEVSFATPPPNGCSSAATRKAPLTRAQQPTPHWSAPP